MLVKIAAVVVAAGSGSRMGTKAKKQFLILDGKPLVGYALEILDASDMIGSIVIVVSPGDEEYCRTAVVDRLGINKAAAIVPGGKERQDSGITAFWRFHMILILLWSMMGPGHFSVPRSWQSVIEAAQVHGAATCAVPAKDTVKLAGEDGFVTGTLPRGRTWLVQTPQAFRYELIIEAHRRSREDNFLATDDAALVESMNRPVKIVMGSYDKYQNYHT